MENFASILGKRTHDVVGDDDVAWNSRTLNTTESPLERTDTYRLLGESAMHNMGVFLRTHGGDIGHREYDHIPFISETRMGGDAVSINEKIAAACKTTCKAAPAA